MLTRVVTSGEDAARLGFTGSPSFRISGRDPFSGPDTPSLACRLYPTGAGLRGLPEQAALTAALAPPRSGHTRTDDDRTDGQCTSASVAVNRPGIVRQRDGRLGSSLECHDVGGVGMGLR